MIYLGRQGAAFWRRSVWHKSVVILAALGLLTIGAMYSIARWYMTTAAAQPRVLGASFIPAYAQSLNLDPEKTMDALIHDVGIRHFRLVGYWNQLEPTKGEYDFRLLDWQFRKAEAADAKVTLSLGLRQPRWPECHPPSWVANEPSNQQQAHLEKFIVAVVNRYKNSSALDSYQLENEFLLRGFGLCTNFDRERLISEYKLVKQTDPHHKVIIARSNNAIGLPIGQPVPDEYGVSIYKRVWGNPPGRYLEYPFPAWFYGFLAGAQKLMTGKDMIIHELQAEAWAPGQQHLTDISLEEQNKSFNAERFERRFALAEGTGMRETYLWGAEYWYYRLVHEHDASVWNVAKKHFKAAQTTR